MKVLDGKGCAASAGVTCGVVSGVLQSTVFNAYDRAMYHSVVHKRPFLNIANWRGNPFTGSSPSFLQRSLYSGLYFPLEDMFRRGVSGNYALDGLLVGMVGGLITTPFNSIKYEMWSSNPDTARISRTAIELYNRGGVMRLMRGAVPTLYRDMMFGITFSYLRHKGDNGFVNNVIAASLATVVSSPFNYARLKVYGADMRPDRAAMIPSQSPRSSTFKILTQLRTDTIQYGGDSLISRSKYLVRSLNIGWGALRVGLGMGLSSQIYRSCMAGSACSEVPFPVLENAVAQCFDPGCKRLDPSIVNLDEAVDEIIERQMNEYCYTLCFEEGFMSRLLYSGFLPICTTISDKEDPIFVMLPKLHLIRCVIVSPIGENTLSSKSTKKLSRKYSLSVSTAFEEIMDHCCSQHGNNCWLYPPMRDLLVRLNKSTLTGNHAALVQVHSIELREKTTGRIVAGEIGYTVGGVYTSMTGFYTVSGTGSVQLFLLSQLLDNKKYNMWDLGMTMGYKQSLGGTSVHRREFVELFRANRRVREGIAPSLMENR